MEEYQYLLDIGIILIVTKGLSLFSRRISLPPVVGALVAGILLGPVVLGIVQPSETLSTIAEIGVIVLMFEAGLETDIKKLKESGLASFIIALIGVIVPLLGGYLCGFIYETNHLQNLFIGVILTATSVSITVETLQDMGKLKTRAGTAILGAAIIDDILGIILLSIMTSIGAKGSADIGEVLKIIGQMLAFFVLASVTGYIIFKFFKWLMPRNEQHKRRVPVLAFAYCLILAYVSELFGIADITGAFIAGVVLCSLSETKYIAIKVETLSYMLITPVFFANIGIGTTLDGMNNSKIIIFTIIITIVAVLTKVIGCGLGAKICKYSTKESAQIGIGMISRGEVALIVANKGMAMENPLMKEELFAPIVIMVIITTLITPILLKISFKDKEESTVKA